ncbi:hypothetical protein BC835DRAFT_1411045 [Cytidiella melzeri]|nr:hypothetical protein BC835DRAFT_1411045 [Cytidiella melzeri]
MAAIPDRKTLSSMRRADLQKLCKERGLKANLKTEELIDLLLDIGQPADPPRVPGRSSSVRVVSRVGSSSTTRGRVGSMIVHDVGEDEQEAGEAEDALSQSGTPVEPMQEDLPGPSTRKKAKETQFKLGVGRPTAIGGAGARAPSSSVGKPRSKRGKGSAAVKPSEAAIQEEEEEAESSAIPDPMHGLPSATQPQPSGPPAHAPTYAEDLKAYISSMVEPLKVHLGVLQAELERATRNSEDLATLQGRDLDRGRLMESLREELAALKLARTEGSEDIRMESGKSPLAEGSRAADTSSGSAGVDDSPKTSLGKRQRESDDSNMTGVIEPGQVGILGGEALAKHVLRPSRKKAKLDQSQGQEATASGEEVISNNEVEMVDSAPRPFTVFSGPEEPPETGAFSDGPPPTRRLSSLFTFPTVTPPNGATPTTSTSTSQGLENQAPSTGNAFSFSFANSIFRPMTSTPPERPSTALPPPQPPTSPTPIGPGSNMFPYAPPNSKPRPGSRPNSRAAQSQAQLGVSAAAAAGPSSAAAPGEGTISPAVHSQSSSLAPVGEKSSSGVDGQGTIYANPIGVGSLGVGLPGIVALPLPPDTPDQPMKRTMYGTELEGDSRFGDFGVEGVAMGFWTGAAPRF